MNRGAIQRPGDDPAELHARGEHCADHQQHAGGCDQDGSRLLQIDVEHASRSTRHDLKIHLAALTLSAAVEYAQTPQGERRRCVTVHDRTGPGEVPFGPAADFFEVVGGREVDQPSREAADYAGSSAILANFPTALYIFI